MTSVEHNPASFEIDSNPGSKKLYFLFGGLAPRLKITPFEFYRVSRGLEGTRIFVRDLDKCWYHLGLRGVTSDIYETADWLKEQHRKSGCEETYFIGNSMGGYAAILFASLTGLGKAVTFAPQTYLSPFLKLRYMTPRAGKQYLKLYRKCSFKPKAWDLRKILGKKGVTPPVTFFYDSMNRTDGMHARHLAGIPGIRIRKIDFGGHNLVIHLKQEGRLLDVLRDECTL